MTEDLGTIVAGTRRYHVVRHKNRVAVYADGPLSIELSLRRSDNYTTFLQHFIKWATTIYRPVDYVEATRLIIKVQNTFTEYLQTEVNSE